MLFTDTDIASYDLLLRLDSQVMDVQKNLDGIAIEGPGSICEMAWSECRSKLESALASFSTYYGPSGASGHIAAVLNTGLRGGYGTRAKLRLNQIICHDTYYSNSLSPLQHWVSYAALAMLYQAASHRVNAGKKGESAQDRYDAKQEFYCKRKEQLWRQILSQGLPYTLAFLDAPGSKHGYMAGTWSNSNLSATTSGAGAVSDLSVQVAITYYDAQSYVGQQSKGNAESSPSAVLSFVIPAGNLLSIDISALNPPDTSNPAPVGLSQGVAPMHNASHWNVYVGAQTGPLYLQNATGIPIATKQYTLVEQPVFSGYVMGPGQFPDPSANLIFGQTIVRG